MRPGRQNQRELSHKSPRHGRGREKKQNKTAGKRSRKDKAVPSYLVLWQWVRIIKFLISYSNVNKYSFIFIAVVPKGCQSHSTAGLFAHKRPRNHQQHFCKAKSERRRRVQRTCKAGRGVSAWGLITGWGFPVFFPTRPEHMKITCWKDEMVWAAGILLCGEGTVGPGE